MKNQISNSFEIKSEIKFQMYCRRGAKNRVDTVTMRRVTSPTGIIYTARFHRRKLRQTIYKLRVTTVQPELLLIIIPQWIITVPPFYSTIYPSSSTNHDSFVPSGSRREHPFILVFYHASKLYKIIHISLLNDNRKQCCRNMRGF